MKNEQKKARRGADYTASRVRSSIAKKLNMRLFFRLVAIFLGLDVTIALITGICLFIYSEQTGLKAARTLVIYGAPEQSTAWEAYSSVAVREYEGEIFGFAPPEWLADKLLEPLSRAARSVEVPDDIWKVTGPEGPVSYRFLMERAGAVYEIKVSLGTFFRFFNPAMAALLICQLIDLLSRLSKDVRMVRKTLDPITELTRAAESLNAVSRQLDPEKMAALAGKIEGINAARLDTRLAVDDTQEELKDLARAINSMLDRINESYRAQVRFVSDASHELRTPIAVIQGYANLLDRWGKTDETTLQESINAIKEEAANMKELVEQLLFLARGDNNTIILQPETFSALELIEEVASEARMIDPSHEFVVRVGSGDTAFVHADRSLIKQALRIMVDNAVKYTDAGGTISFAAVRDGENVRMSVTDTGIGISPENIGRVFDRFYRADESRARATGGAGLGLSIAKWIAGRHNGYMDILSREGIGTRVSIVLPLAEGPKPREEPDEHAAEHAESESGEPAEHAESERGEPV
jgi:two-component system sensor histidine kinase ArlS